jgi:hypothetical protein
VFNVTFPFAYERPEENVVVACHVGTPFTRARTNPSVVFEIDERVLAAVVYNSVFVPPNVFTPVPPLATGRIPVTPVVRDTCPVRLESDKHDPDSEKQPVLMLYPTFDVDVANAEMFNPRSVVVPVFDISKAEMDEVA